MHFPLLSPLVRRPGYADPVIALLLLACAPREPGTDGAAGDAVAPLEQVPGSDPSAAVYDPDRLHEVEITLDEADWEALRAQTRSIYEMLEGDCLSAPWEPPYTWFPAEISVDGEPLGRVGLRKKGLLGSASTTRPSLRVDVDHLVEGARWRGLEKLVFNNNNQDQSRMRSCLAHAFFADAGLVAPRCSLARLRVNGEDLGIYANTEAIDEELIERVEGAPPRTLYEGRLSDFREGWLGSFEAKNDQSDGADLQALADALAAEDEELLERLDASLDLDAFLLFWAAEGVAGHWDGYSGNTNNFYVYGAPEDGRLRFLAGGPDATFDSREPFGDGEPVWVATVGALANRLIAHEEGRARYEARVQELLERAWDEQGRLERLDAWTALIEEEISREERRAGAKLREIVAARAGDIEAQLGGEVEAGALRGSPCFVALGSVSVGFETSFGSYPDGDLYAGGEASTSYEIDGTTYVSRQDGVSVGWYGEERLIWLTISEIADEVWLAPYVLFDPDLLVDGAEIRIDGVQAEAALLYASPETGGSWTTAAYLGDGALIFEAGAAEEGATLRGSLDLSVLVSGG